MFDTIGGIVIVKVAGQELTHQEATAIESTLDKLLEEIRRCDDISTACRYLDSLGILQTELARAVFKWNIDVSERLRRFVRDFDRSDDSDLRSAIFNLIKNGFWP